MTDREAVLLELVHELRGLNDVLMDERDALRSQVSGLVDECAALRARPLRVVVPDPVGGRQGRRPPTILAS